jgi:hypothetical protein
MAEGSTSPPTGTEETVSEGAQEQTSAVESQSLVVGVQGPPPAAATVVEQPEERVEEPDVEARALGESGIMDITSILGAPTVTVV